MASGEDRPPRGREEVTEALLEAAQRLMAERGPANVPLRDIARAAGVNFGLIYRYLGTRDDVLRAVYDRVSARSALRLEEIGDLATAVEVLMTSGDSNIGRTMAWAALEGTWSTDVFGPSVALEHLAQLAAHRRGASSIETTDRLLAGVLLIFAIGWRQFHAIGLGAAGLDDHQAKQLEPQVVSWLVEFGELIARSAD